MRRPQQRVRRQQVVRTVSSTAPVGGLNSRDPIANMKPTDALILDNWFCTPYNVQVRLGYSVQSSGLASPVNTLVSYKSPTVSKLFSFSGANIYDSSSAGAIGSPVLQSNASSKFNYVNFGTSGGNYLFALSGSDLPLLYDGTNWGNAFAAAFNTTVTSITSVGTTATVTMANAHNLKTGMSVVIAGFTPAGYNGTYVITVTGSTTFTYTLTGALGVTTVTGTVTPSINVAITGVNPALLIEPMVFKSRLWMIQKNTNTVWYLPALSIGGAALSIDLGNLFELGGYLIAQADWSLDAGYGMDDYAAFITSEGQVAIYKGTDPASATTWSLVGVYNLGAPVGARPLVKYAGDLLFLCKDGLQPLSKALMSTRVNNKSSVTDKVNHTLSAYITSYGTNFGWEMITYPAQNMLLVNIPISSTQSYQLVMNTISGAWSRFLNWNAMTFCLYNDRLYFGSTTSVAKAWDTLADNGANIAHEAMQSFQYLGSKSQLKKVSEVRPVLSSNAAPNILLGINADFDLTSPTGLPTFTSSNQATWDNALWDVAVWAGDDKIYANWQTVFAIGYCLAVHIVGASNGTTLSWSSTDYMIADGGVI